MTQTTDLVPLKVAAVRKAVDGAISYEDLLRALTSPDNPVIALVPEVPGPVVISDAAKAAIAKLVSTIETAVTPETARALTPPEVASLIDERETLDLVAKVIETRKDAQRTIVFNHLDAGIAEAAETLRLMAEIFDSQPETFASIAKRAGLPTDVRPEPEDMPPLDPKGKHYLAAGVLKHADRARTFVRSLRRTAPTLTADGLKSVVNKDGPIKHADYLAMTTQIRVVDEQKVLLWLRSNPEKASALVAAMTPGTTTAALTVGKA